MRCRVIRASPNEREVSWENAASDRFGGSVRCSACSCALQCTCSHLETAMSSAPVNVALLGAGGFATTAVSRVVSAPWTCPTASAEGRAHWPEQRKAALQGCESSRDTPCKVTPPYTAACGAARSPRRWARPRTRNVIRWERRPASLILERPGRHKARSSVHVLPERLCADLNHHPPAASPGDCRHWDPPSRRCLFSLGLVRRLARQGFEEVYTHFSRPRRVFRRQRVRT